jgi:RNA polymerase sigma-70 factor (ECF subfamily)
MAADDDFDRFYLGARGRLVGQLFALTGDLHDAEDLVQEAFARAAADWRRIRAYDVPEFWVRRVAFNLAHNRGRRLKRHAAALVRLGRPPEVPPMSVDLVALVQALKALPTQQREAVVLHHMAGVPIDQIATQLGAPVGTVKSWLSRGRVALARRLGEPDTPSSTNGEVRTSA